MECCTRKSGCVCVECAQFSGVQLPVSKQAIDYEAATPAVANTSTGTQHRDPHGDDRGNSNSIHSDETTSSFEFSPDPIALDSEGYAISFNADQTAELGAFFKRYGVVIVRDVLSPDDVAEAAAEVFKTAGFGSTPPRSLEELERVNWDDVYGSRYNRSKGFVGYDAPNSRAAWHSRLAPALYQAYRTLFGRKDLLVKLDRFGLMRPTVFGSDGVAPRKDWQTTGEWIHWDQNPWLEPDFVRIQAVLALSDHTTTSGGFHCVPGFCAHWQAWADTNKEYRSDADLVAVPTGDSMRSHLQRLPMRPGSVCLWDSRTPHGNFPNEGRHWRVCQYLGFHPAPHPELQQGLAQTRQDYMRIQYDNKRLPPEITATAHARKLIGLEQWAADELGPRHIISALTAKQLGLWNDFPELDSSAESLVVQSASWCSMRLPILLGLGILGAVLSWTAV